jgi:hypothetical protein
MTSSMSLGSTPLSSTSSPSSSSTAKLTTGRVHDRAHVSGLVHERFQVIESRPRLRLGLLAGPQPICGRLAAKTRPDKPMAATRPARRSFPAPPDERELRVAGAHPLLPPRRGSRPPPRRAPTGTAAPSGSGPGVGDWMRANGYNGNVRYSEDRGRERSTKQISTEELDAVLCLAA